MKTAVWTVPHQMSHIWEDLNRHLNKQKLRRNLDSNFQVDEWELSTH